MIGELMSSLGLTDLELAVLSTLVSLEPAVPLYTELLADLMVSSASTLLPLLLMVQDLYASFPQHIWDNIRIKSV